MSEMTVLMTCEVLGVISSVVVDSGGIVDSMMLLLLLFSKSLSVKSSLNLPYLIGSTGVCGNRLLSGVRWWIGEDEW